MTAEEKSGGETSNSAGRKAWRFGLIASGLLIGVMIVITIASRLPLFDAGFHVGFALVLGIVGTILLGVALMALTFYSDRAGVDDGVVGMSIDEWTPENREP